MDSSIIRMISSSISIILILGVATNGQNFVCPDKVGYFPDPYQCDVYYKCAKGIAEEKLCPDGLVFKDGDPNSERCDDPSNVDCGDRTALQQARPSSGCPRANGYFRHPDPQVCDKFYNCVDGKPHEMSCPPGLVYDEIASTCAWLKDSRRSDCDNSKRDILSDGFTCPREPVLGSDGRPNPHPTFPHPNDCTKFYICRNGVVPQRGSCSGEMVYNEVTMKCDEPEKVPGCENWFKEEKKS